MLSPKSLPCVNVRYVGFTLSKSAFIGTQIFIGLLFYFLSFRVMSQSVSVNTDGSSGPGLFNVGNTATPPFQILPNGQVLGWNSASAASPSYSFVGNGNLGMYRIGANILGFSTSGTERMRILANGNTSIGGTAPTAKLEVVGPATGSGVTIHAAGGGDVLLNPGGALFFDGNYSYAGGSYIRPVGANTQAHFTSGQERMRILPNGNIGMGLGGANPVYGLELGGSFGYGNGTNGGYKSRTESRNDAGLIASQSGFFETASPVNYPSGASSWWHLIDVRHSNPTNNYAMQLAGSFYDQRLYFRKTNNNAAQAWSEVLTSSSDNSATANTAWTISANFAYSPDDITGSSLFGDNTDDATSVQNLGFTMRINGVDYSQISICTNGWIAFGNIANTNFNASAFPQTFTNNPIICPFFTDLSDYGSGEHIRIIYQGTAPNRTTIVHYRMRARNTTVMVAEFQVQFHEGSNLINVKYFDMNPSLNGQNWGANTAIGFQLQGGANAKTYPITFNGKVLDDNRADREGWSVSPVR